MSENYDIVDFEDLTLETESSWLGEDGSGSFTSGAVKFPNSYDATQGSWSGWAYSNTSDVTTASYTNNSAITGSGFNEGSDNYVITNSFTGSYFTFSDTSARELAGLYVTNATYAALSMQNGDDFGAKKFGGESGDDEDWFKLTFTGKKDGTETSSVEFMLADYRGDNSTDYIVDTWEFVDLSSLGVVDTVMWGLSSTDNGDWGMNTPGYFCMDNIQILAKPTSAKNMSPDEGFISLKFYPNPSSGQFFVETGSSATAKLAIFDMSGRMVYSNAEFMNGDVVELNAPAAQYILKVVTEGREFVEQVIVK